MAIDIQTVNDGKIATTFHTALARMRSYEGANITSPSRSIEVETRSASRG